MAELPIHDGDGGLRAVLDRFASGVSVGSVAGNVNRRGAMVLGGAGKRLISNDDLRGSAGASPAYAPLLQFTPPTTPPPPTATCKFSMILRNKNIEAPLGGLMPIAAALRIAMIALGLVEQVLALVAVAKHLRKDS